MPLTDEQWKEIESTISMPYGRVNLKCDGHDITAVMKQIKPMRFGIAVYLDGRINFKKLFDKDEVAMKFYPLKTRSLFTGKERAAALEISKQRGLDKELKKLFKEKAEAKLSALYPYWSSAKAFCRHIRKNCTEIELIGRG